MKSRNKKSSTTQSGAVKGIAAKGKSRTATSGTAKAGRTKQNRSSGPGRTVKNVWRIFHFQERFEMDEYRRQGGLDYIRMFVTSTTQGKSNESTEFFQQLAELKNYYPEKYYSFFGIFWTLASLTATREDWLRGYLLDGDLLPLSEGKLAARLQSNLKETRAALIALKRVGLIEYKPCPAFNKPKREKEKTGSQKQTKNRQPGKRKSDTGTSKKAAIRKRSETFGNVSEPFKNKNKNGIKKRIKTEKEININIKADLNKPDIQNPNETNTKQELEAAEQNKKLSTTGELKSENPISKSQQQKQALMQAQSQNSEQKPVEPENPIESEAAAVIGHHVPKQPSPAYRRGKAQSIGNIISGVFPEYWQDADCEAFGWQIVEALGYATERQNPNSRSEWGSFASWLSRVKQASSSGDYPELKAVAIEKAEYVRKKAKSARNRSAVWFRIMEGVLSSRGISLQPARASPA